MPLKGGKEHPVSERQRRWAYIGENEGLLKPGTAMKWSRRMKKRKARQRGKER